MYTETERMKLITPTLSVENGDLCSAAHILRMSPWPLSSWAPISEKPSLSI